MSNRLASKFLWIFLCFSIELLSAQNLVENGSFESHRYLDCLTCHNTPEGFAGIMQGWKNLTGSNPFICNCKYKRNGTEAAYNYCPLDRVKPYDGCTMMEMEYIPSCYDFEHLTRGCASYVATKLSSPLEIGKPYEISFWINIQKPQDAEYVKHIGFMFYADLPRNKKGEMLNGSDFLIDSYRYNNWYKVKWTVRPICKLEYLTIGVFRAGDGPPVNGKPHRNVYYIDQVAVEKIEENNFAPKGIISFCNYEHQDNASIEEVAGVTCYFNFKDSFLLPQYHVLLDSFAKRMHQNPHAAFMISGHTDSIGLNNKELSSKRISHVLQYLKEKHGIPPLKFVIAPAGSSNPAFSNHTEKGRSLNRRVEIKQVACSTSMVIYRNFLLEVFNDRKEEAFKYLRIWLSMVEDEHKLLVLFDPRIEVLKKDRAWQPIAQQIKKTYNPYKNKELAYRLDSLWAEDQKYRTLGYHLENLAAYFHEMDQTDSRWDVVFSSPPDSLLTKRDQEHYEAFSELVAKNEWPRISEVGKRPAKAAFLMVNHTMDTLILANYLPLIREKCEEGEAGWLFYATMYDRLATIKGLPQKFGTQYKMIDPSKNEYELFPLEDAAKVNQWRKEIGLERIDGY